MITTCMIKLTKTNATMQWSTGLLTFDRNCTAVILVILNSVNEFSAGTMHAWVSYVTVQTRPDQPVARGQHVASDTVLCCPRRDFKWENVVWHFPWQSRDRMQKKFWKPTSCSFMETYITLLNGFVKMCYSDNPAQVVNLTLCFQSSYYFQRT